MAGEQSRMASGKIVVGFLQQMHRYFLDAFFPLECVSCGREGDSACEDCLSVVPFFEAKREFSTAVPRGQSPRDSCPVDNFVIGYSYSHSVIKGIIRGLKFRSLESLKSPIELLARRAVVKNRNLILEFKPLAVVPIPSADSRLRERGLDVVAWIARVVADELNLPVMNLLQADDHERQSRLGNSSRRKANIKGAFEARTSAPRSLILVDDVVTSGATVSEARSELVAAGAEKVTIFGLARGGKRRKE